MLYLIDCIPCSVEFVKTALYPPTYFQNSFRFVHFITTCTINSVDMQKLHTQYSFLQLGGKQRHSFKQSSDAMWFDVIRLYKSVLFVTAWQYVKKILEESQKCCMLSLQKAINLKLHMTLLQDWFYAKHFYIDNILQPLFCIFQFFITLVLVWSRTFYMLVPIQDIYK